MNKLLKFMVNSIKGITLGFVFIPLLVMVVLVIINNQFSAMTWGIGIIFLVIIVCSFKFMLTLLGRVLKWKYCWLLLGVIIVIFNSYFAYVKYVTRPTVYNCVLCKSQGHRYDEGGLCYRPIMLSNDCLGSCYFEYEIRREYLGYKEWHKGNINQLGSNVFSCLQYSKNEEIRQVKQLIDRDEDFLSCVQDALSDYTYQVETENELNFVILSIANSCLEEKENK